jgi:hypothetical protein
LPGFAGAALNRQVVLALLQLLAINLPLLSLLLLDLLLLLSVDLALLDLLLLNLLLLLAVDVADLLLLLALDLTLLVLLLLDLLLLLPLDATLLLQLLLLLALLILLLLLLRSVRLLATCAATDLITWRRVTGPRLPSNAHTQQAKARQTPDTQFHAFLSEARIHEAKTSLMKRRSPHAISALPVAHLIAGKEKGSLARLPSGMSSWLGTFGTGSLHVVLWTHAARGPGQPFGAGGRSWPDWASRAGRYVRAVILVKRIGLSGRQRIAKNARQNITCAIFYFRQIIRRNTSRKGELHEQTRQVRSKHFGRIAA